MGTLILGVVLFIAMHLVRIVAPGLRNAGIEKLGNTGWKILYSVVSLIGLFLMIRGFGAYRAEGSPVIYDPPLWMGHITILLMALALIFITTADLPSTGYIKATLKHPMLIAIKTWAIAHLLINGDLASIILFGSFLVWAIISVIAIKKRGDEPPVATSFKPDIIAIVIGLGIWLIIVMWLHTWLIGVPVIA